MSNYSLKADPRIVFGRKIKAIRKVGLVPANIFGKNIKSIAIQLELKTLKDVLKKAGETNLIDIVIKGNATHPVLVAGYAQDSVTGDLLHVDFHKVDLNVKTTAMVPLKPVGESDAVKAGNVLVLQRNEIEVEALPADLPNEIEVDITTLTEVGSTIHAKDLKLDRNKVALMVEDEEVIATVQEPAQEEAPAAPAEGEAATTPAEADAAPKAEEPKKE